MRTGGLKAPAGNIRFSCGYSGGTCCTRPDQMSGGSGVQSAPPTLWLIATVLSLVRANLRPHRRRQSRECAWCNLWAGQHELAADTGCRPAIVSVRMSRNELIPTTGQYCAFAVFAPHNSPDLIEAGYSAEVVAALFSLGALHGRGRIGVSRLTDLQMLCHRHLPLFALLVEWRSWEQTM